MESKFITQLLETAKSNAKKVAIVDNDGQRETTYEEMMLLAYKVVRYIKQKGIDKQSFVCVKMPSCMEYFATEIGIWLSKCAAVPLGDTFPQSRIDYIQEHCQSVLTIDTDSLEKIKSLSPEDGVVPEHTDNAMLMYTSGSTGMPKGILHTFEAFDWGTPHTIGGCIHQNTIFGNPAPFYFIAIQGMYDVIINGGTVHMYSNEVRSDAEKMAQYIADKGITLSYIPPALLPLFHNRSKTLTTLAALGDKLTNQCSKDGYVLYNIYGMTEVCGSVLISRLPETPSPIAPIGLPKHDVEMKVVDEQGKEVRQGETGELCLKGHFCKEYFKDPERTAELYEGGWLHTNDLVRQGEDGQLYYVQRKDWMVKINGLRVEPGEVENAIKKLGGIKNAVVKGFDNGENSQYLCAYYISDTLTETELATLLAKESSLPGYMIPSFFVRVDKFQLNASGKVDRKLLQAPQTATLQREYVAAENEVEEALCEAFADVCGLDRVGATDDFFTIGGNSIRVLKVQALCKQLNLTSRIIFDGRTSRRIAQILSEQQTSANALSGTTEAPLTQTQLGIYLECMKHEGEAVYNNPYLYRFTDKVDFDRLKCAIIETIKAHPAISARIFISDDGVPMMKIAEDGTMTPECSVETMSNDDFEQLIPRLLQPFNILTDRLYRIRLIETTNAQYLFVDFHHIISDGTSMHIFLDDVNKAYEGETIEKEIFSGLDEACREYADRGPDNASDIYANAKKWYDATYAEADHTSVPFADRQEKNTTFGSSARKLDVSYSELEKYCESNGITVNVLTTAAFSYLLSIFTRESLPVFATIYNGRQDIKTSRTFSMMVKTLPIACKIEDNETTEHYAKKLMSQLIGAMANDIYSFAEFSASTGVSSDVMFAYQDDMHMVTNVGGVGLENISLPFIATGILLDTQVVRNGNELSFEIQYHSNKYSEGFIDNLISCYNEILKGFICKEKMSDIEPLNNEAKCQILKMSTGASLAVDFTKTFVDIFVGQAKMNPDAVAVVSDNVSYSYTDLDRKSNAIANYLVNNGIESGDFVCISMLGSADFVAAAIGIEKAGAAYVPVDPEYPEDRKQYMQEDCESKIILTEELIATICSDPGRNEEPVNFSKPEGIAYMIYTSGSTGKPKGVMIPHSAKMNFVTFIAKEWHHTDKSRICCHSSVSFDASIEDLYPVLTVGGTLYIVPQAARKDMELLYKYIVDNGITGGCYTTQLGQMLLQQYPDLPVEYLVVGGEKMTSAPVCRCRLINTYGPTEFTVDATYFDVTPGKEYKNIPIGRPLGNLSAYVVDRYGHLVPQGIPGELCMSGPQMARGYWKREDLTAEKFTDCGFTDGRMYHTGDLVRYNGEGQIEYLGRIDSQVKLRGFRIELGEIETLIAGYAGVEMCSVQVKEVGGVQHLCAYYTSSAPINRDELKDYLASQLTDYMVPTAYIQLDEMPLMPSGKVNTKALPEPEVETGNLVSAETDTEKKIYEVACRLLGHSQFGVTTNLISGGMTSLLAMRLSAILHQQYGLDVRTSMILSKPYIRDIAKEIDENETSWQTDAVHEKLDYYPLTENQRGVYIDWEMNSETTQYNIPVIKRCGNADPQRLRDAVIAAVNAHPYLKLKFVKLDGDVMQHRNDEDSVEVNIIKTERPVSTEELQSRVRPFDLLNDRLYRFEIYDTPEGTILFTDIHHIVYDGVSDIILMSDISKAYAGESLQPEIYSAFDFALEEMSLKNTDAYHNAEKYIDEIIGDGESTVYPHSVQPDSDGPGSDFRLRNVDGNAINEFCRLNQLTPSNYFLTSFIQVLHRVTREETIVITTVSNGRNDNLKSQSVVGMFVKTLVACSTCTPQVMTTTTFAQAAKAMQMQSQKVQSYDFYPFTEISSRHQMRAEMMYVYEGGLEVGAQDSVIKGEEYLKLDSSKIPITLYVIPEGNNYTIRADYDTSLYSKDDIDILLMMVATYAENSAKAKTLAETSLLDAEAHRAVMNIAAGKHLDIDSSQTFASLFIKQAQKTPNALAVADDDSEYSYEQLDKYSNAYAHILIEKGVKQNMFVCVMLDRTKEFPLTVLAIHKVGAAYTPLDLEYPNERISYMVENSESPIVITTHGIYAQKMQEGNLELGNVKILYLDDIDLGQEAEPINLTTPDNLAYMIYTSGSTGKPKGVILHQRGLRSYIASMIDILGITAEDRISNHRPFSFDAHIQDLYPALTVGGSIHIMPSVIRKDMTGLRDFIIEHKITGGSYTTSLGAMLLDAYNLPLRYMTLTGEKMVGLVSKDVQLVNGYGPTECTDLISAYILDKDREYKDIPIGRPMANSYCFVLDSTGNLLPVGVAGELCFASVQVGKGYWKLPDKTDEVFVDCPFLPEEKLRMYHTGDLCRWNPERNIDYLGRIDSQVKLRGFRIELGEIESKSVAVDGIKQSVALIRKVNGTDHLVLYYTLKENYKVSEDELRTSLEKSSLAEYMIPDTFVLLDEFPFTPSGKINRKALPDPIIKAADIVAPETEMEKELFDMLVAVLGHSQFGVTSNLVSVGLTSLSAMKIGAQVEMKYSVHLRLPDVMKDPRIRHLAELIESSGKADQMESVFANIGVQKPTAANTQKKINLFAKKK